MLLLRMHREHRTDTIDTTHEALAAQLGVYRETVTTALNNLRKRGLISIGHKQIHLLNISELEKLSKAAPHPGAARNQRLSGRAPENQSTPDLHPLPDRAPWPPRPRNAQQLGSYEMQKGFDFNGTSVPLISPQGIFTPALLDQSVASGF